jgi:transcriptional regulator with XRE-family HTH domain
MTDPNEGLAGPNGEPGWTVDDSEFAARLVLVRFRLRWNVKQAAQECGLSATQWAAWENGSMPRRYVETCKAIASRTGVDYLWLLTGGPETSLPPELRAVADPDQPAIPRPRSQPKVALQCVTV